MLSIAATSKRVDIANVVGSLFSIMSNCRANPSSISPWAGAIPNWAAPARRS